MMVPKCILLLLFVIRESSFIVLKEVQIKVAEKTESTFEGSSVIIPCAYLNIETNLKLLWFKDPEYDKTLQMFNGTIVYSNKDKRPQSPEYSNRVEYITNATSAKKKVDWIQCDLRINDLQKTDSGKYGFRFIGTQENKYMSNRVNLIVKDNPCKVHIEPSEQNNPLKESEEFTVNCSTFGSCPTYPQWLINTSEQKQEWTSSSLADVIQVTEEKEKDRKVTKLTLNVSWKDDKRILSCRPAQEQDSFQIRNTTVSVEYAPKGTTAKVNSEDVKEKDHVTLSCSSTGRPDVSFSWFKKNKKEMSQQKSDLKLYNVKPEDSGEYYCEAKNQHGEQKSNIITIDVKYGPKYVTVKPAVNINDLKEGDKLDLDCSVERSNPQVNQFAWYKNNSPHQTNKTLIIREITADDRGSYHCTAGNGIKTVKSNVISVSVKYSPRQIEIQGDYSVKVNSRLTLRCLAEANPKPERYTWKHTPGLPTFPVSSQTGALNIDNVTIRHAGQYTCDVTNSIGERSRTINVDVLYPPSELTLIMKREVREFEVFSIICMVQSFPASTLTVTGPQNLRNVQNNRGNITQFTNNLTVFLNVTESDAGRYKCIADNSEGRKEKEQELTVLYAPKNVTAISKGELVLGSELNLSCEARSKPALCSYEWMKVLNGQLKTVGYGQELYFHSLIISDSGQFVCIANNSIGKTRSQSLHIRVKHTPIINIIHNRTDEWNLELAVSLTCSADAHPPATDYKWYREEDNTTVLSERQNLTVLPQNPGMYYCTATNSIGTSQSNHINLFNSSNSLKVFFQIILPLILLLILIVVAIFLIRRTYIKGSQNNTQDNLSMEDIPDQFHGTRVNQSHPTAHSQDPTRAQDFNPRPESNVQTVYSVINMPHMKQGKCSPKSNGSAVYAMVSKNKQPKNSQAEHDYENVSSACAPRLPFTNTDWESDTSEEDEVNYTTVSCSTKPDVKEPKHNQMSHLSSSSSDEDRTEYSAIKT